MVALDFGSSYLNTNTSIKIVRPLYHASKSGIKGNITPSSREECDFGKGFYMGTTKEQPLTLVCNYPSPYFYEMELDISDLRTYNFKLDIEWAMFIAYNRKKMEHLVGSTVYTRFQQLRLNYDVFVGNIADDRMFVVLERFFEGDITDEALINSLSALKLGKQYVPVTQRACDRIKILKKSKISEEDLENLKVTSVHNRSEGIRMAEAICKKYRRTGKYFDELY